MFQRLDLIGLPAEVQLLLHQDSHSYNLIPMQRFQVPLLALR